MSKKNKKQIDPVACKIPKSPDEKTTLPETNLQSSDSMTWRIFRIMAEFVTGFQFIAQYQKTISFFGSARVGQEDRYYQDAQALARKLGNAGFNIITGGGPGMMEAANRGAHEAGVNSIGLNIQLPFEQRINRFVTRGVGFHYFFTRKVMLSAAGQAYVYFPGGFGTMDEFFEIITLIQTKKMERVPVVLYGRDFWDPLLAFIDTTLCEKYKTIDKDDRDLFAVCDTVAEAFKILSASKPRVDF
ncbi:Rossman fold protein, TIGR00730 family [bacterium CG10_46_32]|nr:MAG: Rossman fold protein, TIGR00730 family [bacterium CG10_46_32]PIR55770.1 MAG: TIGR00730 family Rossman fold protein [Parcubacteria group bacterium CG10_big_fil_rev_8_21_14_0_10_46_32]